MNIKANDTTISGGSTLLERIRSLGSLIGMMFQGKRDLYGAFGYKVTLTYDDFLRKYARQDIAARIVEAEPKATWSDGIALVADETFKKAWEDIIAQHSLYHVFIRLDKLAGLGPYSVLLMGFADGRALDQPVAFNGEDSTSNTEILYMQPYSSKSATVHSLEQNPQDPRFGLPAFYEINPGEIDTALSSANKVVKDVRTRSGLPFRVHHSRILHVAENVLEDPIYGFARLQRVYNLLDDLAKISGGSAETYWMIANRGMQIDVDKDMDLKKEDLEDLADEIDEYQHNIRRVMRTRGVKVNMLGSDVADPRGVFDVLVSLISGATGIPQRILLGSEAGQLASEQDRANWATRISERRQDFAEPTILLPFIRAAINAGALPSPTVLEVKWPEAFKMSPLERAQTAAQKARTLANVAKALSDDQAPVTPEEARQIIGIEEPSPIFDSKGDTQAS